MKSKSPQFTKQSNPKLVLVAIFIAIILPLIIGYVYLKLYQSGADLGQRNHGVLFQQTINLVNLDLDFVNQSYDEPKWILLQIFNQNCQNQCESRARIIGNIVTALGKYSNRVEPVLLYDSVSKNRFLEKYNLLSPESQQQALENAENSDQRSNSSEIAINHYPVNQFEVGFDKLTGVINQLASALSQSEGTIQLFFIDPRGRFILGFKDQNDAKQIIQDMRILLRSSLIG